MENIPLERPIYEHDRLKAQVTRMEKERDMLMLALEGLFQWADYTGGWEGKAWTAARKIYRDLNRKIKR